MGTDARGIGSRNRWPCVGDPATWQEAGNWFNCGAEGSLSLVAAVPQAALAASVQGDDQGAIVHLTVCKTHVAAAREWLRTRTIPGEDVDTWGTEMLMREWGQVVELAEDTPIYRRAALA